MDQVSEQPRMDERGRVELDDSVPKAAKIDGGSAVIEAREMTTGACPPSTRSSAMRAFRAFTIAT